ADSAQKPADLLGKVYYPEVVRMDLSTKKPWKLMWRGTVLATVAGVLTGLVLLVAGRWVVDALFGAEFLPAYPVLLVLIVAPFLAMVSFPLVPMLYALDRPDAPLKARLIGTLLYFAVVAPLAWRFGVIGAAIAFVIGVAAMVAVQAVQLLREYRRVRAR
ncbi:MAG TPA: polysaccharide biosynthesis C-terminal domain-containing protein, partial [Sphingomicrobium sp.]|nr:polysaccharide biosynthesis C-terminal domain-containing protein [Sphingomicrobium sp.]